MMSGQVEFQRHENDEAMVCIVHEPCLANLWGNLHPVGNLHERPFDLEKAIQEHRDFVAIMESSGVCVRSVSDILAEGCRRGEAFDMGARIRLEELAMKNLQYQLSPMCDRSSLSDEERFYLSDEYKRQCIEKINTSQLLDVVFTCPVMTLDRSHRDTALEAVEQTMNPVGNLIFTRDQQITTAKGIVFGRMASPQRAGEVEIMHEVFNKLGVPVIGSIADPGRLEGGDYLPAGDTCFIGTGLRTNSIAVHQLMEQDLLGFDTVVEVQDIFERSQDRMHLDCVFNIVGDRTVMLLDTLMQPNSSTRRLVIEYVRQPDASYTQSRVNVEFSSYLKHRGYKIIGIPEQFQLQYGVNCLNLGRGRLIMMHEASARLVAKDPNFKGSIKVVDYSNVTSMYGSLHCTSQIVHRKRRGITSRRPSLAEPVIPPSPLHKADVRSSSIVFVCEDVAYMYRDGVEKPSNGGGEDDITPLPPHTKGREIQRLVLQEISTLCTLLTELQNEVLVVPRDENFFSSNAERCRPQAFCTPHLETSTLALYNVAGKLQQNALHVNMGLRFANIIECPLPSLLGALDFVVDYHSKRAFVSDSFLSSLNILETWCTTLDLSLMFVSLAPNVSLHLADVLFFSSGVIVWCPEALPSSSIDSLQDGGVPRLDLRVSLSQARRFCCSLVELHTHSGKYGLLLSASVMRLLTDDQRNILKKSTDSVWQCDLSVCESIELGSVRDFVVSLTY